MIQSIAAIPTIMRVIADTTGLRWVGVARVTPEQWTLCTVNDQLNFGLKPGDELEIASTFCDQVRRNNTGMVIDNVKTDAVYCTHAIPRDYGFESYFSLPVYRKDGSFFGTLCGLDPVPADLRAPKTLDTLKLFAELISTHIETEERLKETENDLKFERENSRLRERFIAILGHDVRTPLSAMLLGADLIGKLTSDEKIAAVSMKIKRSGLRIRGLIDDVTDFTRANASSALPLCLKPVDNLASDLEHVIGELAAAYPERSLQRNFTLTGALRCDPKRISQLLSNLIVNAIVHGFAHTDILVTASNQGSRLRIAVANRGKPVADETRQRMFMPFSRGAGTEQTDGLGLGLYIASEIAKSHAGSLRLESTGEYTEFIFEADCTT
ncbi:sensor histidine kinase [Herbaspirillum autotrophicum]|uniref:sensor histidine kinase n=1 Tax=Herbaspirillum autotrophicum TaxID=180195 RepID=UPI00067ADF21|nr:HAMP domain-containing sensor histidine kinase [Herbaspirillum autotrophicum]